MTPEEKQLIEDNALNLCRSCNKRTSYESCMCHELEKAGELGYSLASAEIEEKGKKIDRAIKLLERYYKWYHKECTPKINASDEDLELWWNGFKNDNNL